MNIILIMIPLSLLVVIGAAIAFFWAVNKDQFEDLDSPGLLPLADDPEVATDGASNSKKELTLESLLTDSPKEKLGFTKEDQQWLDMPPAGREE